MGDGMEALNEKKKNESENVSWKKNLRKSNKKNDTVSKKQRKTKIS